MDLLTTFSLIGRFGTEVEANPVMKYALSNWGMGAYFANFFAFLLAVLFLYKRKSFGSLVIIAVIMLAACLNNLHYIGLLGV